MQYIYYVNSENSRSFTQQAYMSNGSAAIIRVQGESGVIDADGPILAKDLDFLLKKFSLTLASTNKTAEETITAQESVVEPEVVEQKPKAKSKKSSLNTTTTYLDVQFIDD